eukprot:scaffold191334_cov93-Attheya_sp.AAC.1
MEMERDPIFECLDFSNIHRKKDLDRIFPIKRGKLLPPNLRLGGNMQRRSGGSVCWVILHNMMH